MKRRSHPMREVAVDMMRRGEALPHEIVVATGASRQLVYYWCKVAGLLGKVADARRAHVLGQLMLRARGLAHQVNGRKVRMRKIADRAKREWDARHAKP